MIYRVLGFLFVFSFLPTYLLGQGTPAILSSPSAVQGVINVCISNPVVAFSDTTNLAGFLQTWTFQNGTPATATGPGPHNVTFSDTGYVVLTVLDSATNQTTTDSVLVQVNTVTPNLTYSLLEGNNLYQTTTFNGLTYYRKCGVATNNGHNAKLKKTGSGANNSTRYSIDWGDGQIQDSIGNPLQPLTGANWPSQNANSGVIHNYANQGFYTITITATNANGCSSINSVSFFWGSTPAGGLNNPGGAAICLPDNLPFPLTNISTNVPGTIYTLSVSDATVSPVTYIHPSVPDTFIHFFQFPSCGYSNGQDTNCFSVDLVITNPCGTATSQVAPVYVSTKNNSGFLIAPDTMVCQNIDILVIDTTAFGVNAQSPLCDSIVARYWVVDPNSGFSVVSGYLGDTIAYWNQPQGWTSGSDSLLLSFSQPGVYTIKMLNGNACDQIDSVVKQICILPLATATFQASDTLACVPASISIDNQTTTTQCGSDSWLWRVQHSDSLNCGSNSWSFANNTDSLSFEPEFNFAGAGVYTITLISNYPLSQLDTLRCPADTTVHTVRIADSPVIDSLLSPINVCYPDSATFTAFYSSCYDTLSIQRHWFSTFGTPDSLAQDSITISFPSPGNYYAAFFIDNQCGGVSDSVAVAVLAPPTVNAGNDTTVCYGSSIPLTGTLGGGASSGIWTAFGDTLASFAPNDSDLNATYSPSAWASSQVILFLTTDDPVGPCPSFYDTLIVTFDSNATVNVAVPSNACEGNPISLSAILGGTASSGVWTASVPGTFSPSNTNLNPTFSTNSGYTGSIVFSFVSNDPPGVCEPDSASDTLMVHPIPILTVNPPSLSICNGGAFSVGVSSSVNGSTFSWSIDTNTSITGIPFSGTGAFVNGTLFNAGFSDDSLSISFSVSANGCPGTPVSSIVVVRPVPFISPINDTTVCELQTIGAFNFSPTPQNSSIAWLSSNPNFMTPSSGTGNIPSFSVPANTGSNQITTQLILTPT